MDDDLPTDDDDVPAVADELSVRPGTAFPDLLDRARNLGNRRARNQRIAIANEAALRTLDSVRKASFSQLAKDAENSAYAQVKKLSVEKSPDKDIRDVLHVIRTVVEARECLVTAYSLDAKPGRAMLEAAIGMRSLLLRRILLGVWEKRDLTHASGAALVSAVTLGGGRGIVVSRDCYRPYAGPDGRRIMNQLDMHRPGPSGRWTAILFLAEDGLVRELTFWPHPASALSTLQREAILWRLVELVKEAVEDSQSAQVIDPIRKLWLEKSPNKRGGILVRPPKRLAWEASHIATRLAFDLRAYRHFADRGNGTFFELLEIVVDRLDEGAIAPRRIVQLGTGETQLRVEPPPPRVQSFISTEFVPIESPRLVRWKRSPGGLEKLNRILDPYDGWVSRWDEYSVLTPKILNYSAAKALDRVSGGGHTLPLQIGDCRVYVRPCSEFPEDRTPDLIVRVTELATGENDVGADRKRHREHILDRVIEGAKIVLTVGGEAHGFLDNFSVDVYRGGE